MIKKTASRFWLWLGLPAVLLALVASAFVSPAAASAASAAGGPAFHQLAHGQLFTGGKSHHSQDSAWMQLKLAYRVRAGSTAPRIAASYPSSYLLNTTYVKQISEPAPVGTDAAGRGYTDYYMWYICGPGATNVAMDFWANVNNRNVGGHNYSDPHTTTYWNDNSFRAYTMYTATQVRPPSYTSPGEETYGNYSSAYTTFNDLRDAMNWEASGHNTSNWSNYFYITVGAGSLSFSSLQSYIMSDVSWAGHPPVVSVNDAYLPDWSNSGARGTSHFITIVGYDNNAGTFTYIETCGSASCGTSGTGQYTVSQSTLYNGIQNDNGNGGIVW